MPPSPPEPDLQVAARLLAEGRPADAAERLAALVAEAPVYAAAHVLLATALEVAGRPDEALAAWGRAAVLVPSSPLVHRERRRLLELARTPAPAPPDEDGAANEEPAASLDDAAPEVEGGEEEEDAPGAYDLRAVDERFLRDDDAPEADDEPDGPPSAAAPPEPGDLFFGPPAPPAAPERDGPSDAELLPPEAPAEVDLPGVTPETPGGPGWSVVDEEDRPPEADRAGAEADVVPPDAPSDDHPVADELDALISKLQDAPRIRPDPAFSGPSVVFDDSRASEVASETLAKIYAAQGQYKQAAEVYETLAARQPERAEELLARADEVRRR